MCYWCSFCFHIFILMEVSWNGDTSRSSILTRFSTINQPFRSTPILGKPSTFKKRRWIFSLRQSETRPGDLEFSTREARSMFKVLLMDAMKELKTPIAIRMITKAKTPRISEAGCWGPVEIGNLEVLGSTSFYMTFWYTMGLMKLGVMGFN